MIDPPFIEGEGMPIKIRTDADENRADVTVLPVLRDGELPPATFLLVQMSESGAP
jgi:hypothetical protein